MSIRGTDHAIEASIDAAGQLFGDAPVLVKRLPFQLTICLPDEDRRRYGERKEKQRDEISQATPVESGNQAFACGKGHYFSTMRR